MVIQIDVDDTITRAPEFFKHLTRSLKRDGHTILIVTTRTDVRGVRAATKGELLDYGIFYDKLILSPPLDELDEKTLPPGLAVSRRPFAVKVTAARDHKVEVVFDDCGITIGLLKKYLPKVQVMQVLP